MLSLSSGFLNSKRFDRTGDELENLWRTRRWEDLRVQEDLREIAAGKSRASINEANLQNTGDRDFPVK